MTLESLSFLSLRTVLFSVYSCSEGSCFVTSIPVVLLKEG